MCNMKVQLESTVTDQSMKGCESQSCVGVELF